MKSGNVSASASGGVGIVGWLILFGLLGIGPCEESCRGCGPTPASIYKTIQQEKCEVSR